MRSWGKGSPYHHQLIDHLAQLASVLGQQRFALVAAVWTEA